MSKYIKKGEKMFEVLKKKENEKLMTVIAIILVNMFMVLGQILLLGQLNQYLIANVNKYIIPIITFSVVGIFLLFDFMSINYFTNKKLNGNQ